MNREDFLTALSEKIAALPYDEKNKIYEYYNEIILDKLDAGMEEEEIIAAFGDIDEIAAKTLAEYLPEVPPDPQASPQAGQTVPQAGFQSGQQGVAVSQTQLPPETPKKYSGGMTALIVVLLIFSSPIWLSLLLAFFAVAVSVVCAVASVILSLWAVDLSLLVSGLCMLLAAVLTFPQNLASGLLFLAGGLFCLGLCCLFTIGMVKLTQLSFRFLAWLCKKTAGLFRRKRRILPERSVQQ